MKSGFFYSYSLPPQAGQQCFCCATAAMHADTGAALPAVDCVAPAENSQARAERGNASLVILPASSPCYPCQG